jgi:hypothetical protein
MANYQFYTCCKQDAEGTGQYLSLFELAKMTPNPDDWSGIASVGPAVIGRVESADIYALYYYPTRCGSYPATTAEDQANGIIGRDSFSVTLTSESGATFTGTVDVLVADCSIVRARPESYTVPARLTLDGDPFLIPFQDIVRNDTNGAFNGIAREPRLGTLGNEYRGVLYYAPTCEQIAAAGGVMTDDFEYKIVSPDIYVPDGPTIPGVESRGTITITLTGCSDMRAGDVFIDLCCGDDSNTYDIPFTTILANSTGTGISLVDVSAPITGTLGAVPGILQYTMPSCLGFARDAIPAVPGTPAIPGTPTIPAVPGANAEFIDPSSPIFVGGTGGATNARYATFNQAFINIGVSDTLQVGDLIVCTNINNAIATGGREGVIEDGWTTVADHSSLNMSFHYYYRFADQAYIDKQAAAPNQNSYPYFSNAQDGPGQTEETRTKFRINLQTYRRPIGAPESFPLLQSINAQYTDSFDGATALYNFLRSDKLVRTSDFITVYGYPETQNSDTPVAIRMFGQTIILAYSFFKVIDLVPQINAALAPMGIKARILDPIGQDVTDRDFAQGYLTLIRAAPFESSDLSQLPSLIFGTLDTGTILVPVLAEATTAFPDTTGASFIEMNVTGFAKGLTQPSGSATKYPENFYRGFNGDYNWSRVERSPAGPYPFAVTMRDAATIVAYSLVLNRLVVPGSDGTPEIPGTPGVPAVPGKPAFPAIPVPTSGNPVVDRFTFTIEDATGGRRTANVFVTVEPCFIPPPPIPPTANSVEITVCCPDNNVDVSISLAELMAFIGGTDAKVTSVTSGRFGAARLTEAGIIYTAQPCGFTYVPPPVLPPITARDNTFILSRPPRIRAINDDVILPVRGPKLYAVAGSPFIARHQNFDTIEGLVGGPISVLGTVIGSYTPGELRQDMEIFYAGVLLRLPGVTQEFTTDNGDIITDLTPGHVTLFRETPFTQAEIASLPVPFFGSAARGYEVPQGGPSLILVTDIISNDLGTDFEVVRFSNARYGQITFDEARNGFLYSRPRVFVDQDYFTYTIADASGRESVGTVTINMFRAPE